MDSSFDADIAAVALPAVIGFASGDGGDSIAQCSIGKLYYMGGNVFEQLRFILRKCAAVLYDADQQNFPYIKRFCMEATNRKQNYLGENKNNRLILLTDECYPRLEIIFGGHDSFREPMIIEADEFIAVKGFKAKGKRITTFTMETVNELEPTRQPEVSQDTEDQGGRRAGNFRPRSWKE